MQLNVLTRLNDEKGNPLMLDPTLRDQDGKLVPNPDSEPMTLSHVMINLALQPCPRPDKPYTDRQHIMRYQLALDCWKAKSVDPPVIEVSRRVIAEIKPDLERLYIPIVAGQVLMMWGYKYVPED